MANPKGWVTTDSGMMKPGQYHAQAQNFIKKSKAQGNIVSRDGTELISRKPSLIEKASAGLQSIGRNFAASQNTPAAKLRKAQMMYDEGAGGGSRPK